MCEESNKESGTKRTKRHVVAITGFGLFRDHELNPSWEAIKDGKLIIDRPQVDLIVKQVEVSYEEVDRVVPALWEELNPLLMVHVGLAAHETSIRIEQSARHGPYIKDDVVKHAPHKYLRDNESNKESSKEMSTKESRLNTCKPSDFDCSRTCIDVDRICDKLNAAYHKGKVAIPFKKSEDAGLYVCEYIYQKSLKICDRSVFIHVPDIKDFSLDQIRAALKISIEAIIDEVLAREF